MTIQPPRLRHLAVAAAAAGTAAALYATFVEPRWLRLRRATLHFHDLPPALEGLRIALLTDLHLGPHTPPNLLPRALRLVRLARPHLLAVTGDLAEEEGRLHACLRACAEVNPELGVYLVPGNHDHTDVGIGPWRRAVARYPTLADLTNAAVVLEVERKGERARLCLAGTDDLSEGAPRLDMLPDRGLRDFTVLLAHHPDQAEQVRRYSDDVDLVLSGHLHGGQVRLPGVGALLHRTEYPELYDTGLRRRPWTQVYTSGGVGTVHLPIRFFNRPEVPVLTLTRAPRPSSGRPPIR